VNSKTEAKVLLTSEEKTKFAKALYNIRKSRPNMQWPDCFKEAWKVLPTNRRMSASKRHPSKIPWLNELMKGLENNFGALSTSNVSLTPAERLIFATEIHKLRQTTPPTSWRNSFKTANLLLPEHRRIGSQIDYPNKLSWLAPMLEEMQKHPKKFEKLEETEKTKPAKAGKRILDKEQRVAFAKSLYEIRKTNSEKGWKFAIQEANKTLPVESRFGLNMDSPHQIAWVFPLLEKLEQEDKAHLIIDHRHTLPKVEIKAEVKEETPSGVTVIPEGKKGGKDKSGTRMFLKSDEKMLFAEAVYRARISNLGWSWAQCLIQANLTLPTHRRFAKTPNSPSQMPWLPSVLDEISKRPLSSPDKIISEPKNDHEIIPEVPAALAPPPAIDMQAIIANAIAIAVQQQVQALMGGGINLTGAIANAMAPVNNAKIAEKKPDIRPKVIVVGLLPVQTNEVQKEFGAFYDLRFFGSNTPVPQIRESMKNVDFAVMMTKFVNHSTQSAMRSHPGFIYCNGNSSALKMALKEKLSQ